jgi:hypothetical protein
MGWFIQTKTHEMKMVTLYCGIALEALSMRSNFFGLLPRWAAIYVRRPT